MSASGPSGPLVGKLLKPKSLFLLYMLNRMYVKPNVIMAINKFQRSVLTFDLSAKVAHIEVPSIY